MQKARWYWRNLSSKKRTHNIGNKKLSQGQFDCVLRPLSSAFAFDRSLPKDISVLCAPWQGRQGGDVEQDMAAYTYCM